MNVLNSNDVRIGSYQNDPDNDMNRYDEVLVALRRIIRATDLHSRQLSKIAGLTAPQLLILQLLRQHTELTVGEVAQRVSLSQATVTTIIDRLEKRGFVKRERGSADKRKVYVYLTSLVSNHQIINLLYNELSSIFVIH